MNDFLLIKTKKRYTSYSQYIIVACNLYLLFATKKESGAGLERKVIDNRHAGEIAVASTGKHTGNHTL